MKETTENTERKIFLCVLEKNSYLKAMGKRVGLLINFNVLRLKEGIKRLIM